MLTGVDLADELNEHLRHAIAEDPLHAVAEVARFKAALAGLEREAVFAGTRYTDMPWDPTEAFDAVAAAYGDVAVGRQLAAGGE